MIYTSYFAVMNKLPSNIKKLAIVRWKPKWFCGYNSSKLTPRAEALSEYKKTNDWKVFEKRYKEQVLDNLTIKEFKDYIRNKLNVDLDKEDIVLLCYERSDCNCHRHILREWLNNEGVKCEEYNFNKENIK